MLYVWGDEKCLQHRSRKTREEGGRLQNLGIHAVITLNLVKKKEI